MSLQEAKSKRSNWKHPAILAAVIGASATLLSAALTILPGMVGRPSGPPPIRPAVPTMSDCVGKWRWRTVGRSLIFDLKSDGSLAIQDDPDVTPDLSDGMGLIKDAKGYWKVQNGRLTLVMTHVWLVAYWHEKKDDWIDRVPISGVSGAEITLEGRNALRRRN